MKLTVTVKLQPTPEQAAALLDTLERANAACQHHQPYRLGKQDIRPV